MTRDQALQLLLSRKDEIFSRYGVKRLALFGSTARNEAREDSDVDLLVEFDGPATFDGYFDLKFQLEDILGKNVDLVTAKGIRPRIRPYVEKEAVDVS